jgi:hypothetical protein
MTESREGLPTLSGQRRSHEKVFQPKMGDDEVAGRSFDLERVTTESQEGLSTLSR